MQEPENDWLKREAAIGFAQLETGEVTLLKSKEEFKDLALGLEGEAGDSLCISSEFSVRFCSGRRSLGISNDVV